MNIFKNSQTIIKEIHDSFDSAQDRLLKEAISVLSFVKEDGSFEIEDKAERLKKLGFTSSLVVKEFEKISVEREKKNHFIVKTKKEAELINYYKYTYPFLKFLTEGELDRICNKYNLIYAPVGNYKEDVPDKNLREIENAQPLKKMDVMVKKYRLIPLKSDEGKFNKFLWSIGKEDNVFSEGEDIGLLKRYTKYSQNPWGFETTTWLYVIWDKSGRNGYYSFDSVEEISKSDLFICAPKSHFDLKGLKKNKLGFFNISIVPVDDPIVFRYVKGGIQVLSKWGLEASDKLLTNPVDN